jgi:hypothetical protein
VAVRHLSREESLRAEGLQRLLKSLELGRSVATSFLEFSRIDVEYRRVLAELESIIGPSTETPPR